MSVSFKKLFNDYGIGGIFITIIVLYGLYMLYNNLMSKGKFGNEMMSQNRNKAYNNNSQQSNPQPAQESGNEVYSSVGSSGQSSGMGLSPYCNPNASSLNPTDLLPEEDRKSVV